MPIANTNIPNSATLEGSVLFEVEIVSSGGFTQTNVCRFSNQKLSQRKGSPQRGVAVTVAVRCSTSATFQAFASDPLCAQDFCKLFARCDLPSFDLLTVDDS